MKVLEVHLATLRRQGLIADWNDRMITPGEEWRQTIDASLDSADCVLLLVTPDFIASDYCYSVEMGRALQKHREGRILVLPVIVRPADWQHTPLSELQVLPKDGKPIVEWAVRDRAWLDVTGGLRLALDRYAAGLKRVLIDPAADSADARDDAGHVRRNTPQDVPSETNDRIRSANLDQTGLNMRNLADADFSAAPSSGISVEAGEEVPEAARGSGTAGEGLGAEVRVARAARNDSDHVARLFGDAERVANSISSKSSKAMALSGIAKAMAATDPDHAERVASSIVDEPAKVSALGSIAETLAATDPGRAIRLLNDAERIALSITDDYHKGSALSDVAQARAAIDPDRAERIANSITDAGPQVFALLGVARALAAIDPDRAERIANSIQVFSATFT